MTEATDADSVADGAPHAGHVARVREPHAPTAPTAHDHHASIDSIKHTLTALLIAFILTLTFRGFVMEGFIIPTGSMAPTLLGEHWRVRSPLGGHDWAINGRVGPRAPGEGIEAADPISRTPLTLLRAERSAGDRILVLKWALGFRDPERWDAVVFKYPEQPRENFIKRLVGLPGEDVWLVDGDVFVRKGQRHAGTEARRGSGEATERRSDEGVEAAKENTGSSEPGAEATEHPTDSVARVNAGSSEPGAAAAGRPTDSDWRIVRKPHRVQRALWQPVWSSEEATNEGSLSSPPRADADDPSADGDETRTPPASPWLGDGWEWTNGGRSLRHEGGEHARLAWNARDWPITDWSPYNDPDAPTSRDARRYYPVSDVRVRFVIEPRWGPWSTTVFVRATGRNWSVRLAEADSVDGVYLQDRSVGLEQAPWHSAPILASHEWPEHESPLRRARISLDVCFVDQAVEVWVDGKRALRWEDDLSPHGRLARATGKPDADVAALLGIHEHGAPLDAPIRGNPLADPTLYSPPEISIEFDGGPITLHRLAVDRDIYYRPGVMEADPRIPSRATHPLHLARLSPDEFFVLGDNSGASKDGRLWDTVNPWVARTLDPEPGVVHRSLMLGKAFFVYFPAPHTVPIAGQDRPLVPDFGRMRWIR